MIYITVKTVLDTHRTYAVEDNAQLNINGHMVIATDVQPNTWWDDEYITEVEH